MGEQQEINPLTLSKWLKNNISQITGIATNEINEDAPITQYGLDSSAVLTLACDLEDYTNMEIEHHLLYEYPSIKKIVEFICSQELVN